MRRAPLLRSTALAAMLTCAAVGGPATATHAIDVPASDSTATSTPKAKLYTFENGKTSGWKGVGGATVTVTAGPAISGTQSMRVTGLGAGFPAGLAWSRALTAFPGTDPWYRVQVPIRSIDGEPGVPAGVAWMRVKGAADLDSSPVTVTSDGWVVLEARFLPSPNATSVTFTVEQAPAVDCGTLPPTLGDIVVDDVSIDRVPAPAAASGSGRSTRVQPDCVG